MGYILCRRCGTSAGRDLECGWLDLEPSGPDCRVCERWDPGASSSSSGIAGFRLIDSDAGANEANLELPNYWK